MNSLRSDNVSRYTRFVETLTLISSTPTRSRRSPYARQAARTISGMSEAFPAMKYVRKGYRVELLGSSLSRHLGHATPVVQPGSQRPEAPRPTPAREMPPTPKREIEA